MVTKVAYDKPLKTAEELCSKLVAEGLVVSNRLAAIKGIENFSYYRFKAYLIPYRASDKNQFKQNTMFEDIESLYYFDEALREVLFGLIQKVEIFIRSLFDQHINKETNNNFWYLDSSLFRDNKNVQGTVNTVRAYFLDSKEEFAKHFRDKYFNPFCPFYRDLPPGWVAIELMSFGNLKKFMEAISDEAVANLKLDRLAKKLGCANYQTLLSWVALVHEVRNCCCHHSRVFNRNFSAPLGIKSKLNKDVTLVKYQTESGGEIEQLNRIYSCLVVIQLILEKSVYKKIVGSKMKTLLTEHPMGNRFLPSMGIPQNWEQETLFFIR